MREREREREREWESEEERVGGIEVEKGSKKERGMKIGE